MLQWALDRARSLVSEDRIVPVVASGHRVWWEDELEGLPRENIVVQPRNRGTAAGVLLPLIAILKRDPDATILLLPSDHYVEDEETLRCALERAVEAVRARPERVTLLGVTPEDVDSEYGWILPHAPSGGRETRAVQRFVEKPDAVAAARLCREGAVWNSFLVVASARTLLHLYNRVLANVVEPFLRDLVVVPDSQGLEKLYATLPTTDFSRDLLERVADCLDLLVVPECGWSDLGTVPRLRRYLAAAASQPAESPSAMLSR